MMLLTEELGEVPDVDAATLNHVLASDAFGKFAILNRSEGDFIQAGNDWQPDEACRAFRQSHDSDPWVLEYRQGEQQFRAAGLVTLEQVREAFLSYRAGGIEWRNGYEWSELEQ